MPVEVRGGRLIVYGLTGLHDLNSGAILVMLLTVAVRSRGTRVFGYSAAALAVASFTMLPLPLHGTAPYGFASILATFALFYRSWGVTSWTNWSSTWSWRPCSCRWRTSR